MHFQLESQKRFVSFFDQGAAPKGHANAWQATKQEENTMKNHATLTKPGNQVKGAFLQGPKKEAQSKAMRVVSDGYLETEARKIENQGFLQTANLQTRLNGNGKRPQNQKTLRKNNYAFHGNLQSASLGKVNTSPADSQSSRKNGYLVNAKELVTPVENNFAKGPKKNSQNKWNRPRVTNVRMQNSVRISPKRKPLQLRGRPQNRLQGKFHKLGVYKEGNSKQNGFGNRAGRKLANNFRAQHKTAQAGVMPTWVKNPASKTSTQATLHIQNHTTRLRNKTRMRLNQKKYEGYQKPLLKKEETGRPLQQTHKPLTKNKQQRAEPPQASYSPGSVAGRPFV